MKKRLLKEFFDPWNLQTFDDMVEKHKIHILEQSK